MKRQRLCFNHLSPPFSLSLSLSLLFSFLLCHIISLSYFLTISPSFSLSISLNLSLSLSLSLSLFLSVCLSLYPSQYLLPSFSFPTLLPIPLFLTSVDLIRGVIHRPEKQFSSVDLHPFPFPLPLSTLYLFSAYGTF